MENKIIEKYTNNRSNSSSRLENIIEIWGIIIPSILALIGFIIVCVCCCKDTKRYGGMNYNYDRDVSIGGYSGYGGNNSIDRNSGPSYSEPSYGNNSIGGVSGGAI